MTGEASADDFLKKKRRRKHKNHSKKQGNDEGESIQTAELHSASPLPSEEQAAQSDGDCEKKKTPKKKKKQKSSLNNSCAGLEYENRTETGEDASQKRKKKRKMKYEIAEEQSDVSCVNQDSTDGCQEDHADYVYLKESVKKKRKGKLPEEEEGGELFASETQDQKDSKRAKKKKRRKRVINSQGLQEDKDVTCEGCPTDQSLLSSPEPNRQVKDPEEGGVATPQQRHEEDAAVSKPTKAADQTPVCKRKKVKSRCFVEEDNSSESDVMTPEPSALETKQEQASCCAEMADSDELSLDGEESLECSASAVDLATARRELEEFIPHVRNITDSSIRKMAGRDLARFKEFKKQGIAVKFGRFSQKENNQIRKNLEEFLQITGIDSAEKLLFTSRYPEDKEAIHRLKAEHLFCEKLSEGIPRPWRLIYYRARKMFDSNNYKGRYTDEEKEKLKKYHALHGNDWMKISEMMSRSNLSVAMKYSEIKSAINYGPWSKEETQKLKHAVEEVIRKRIEKENANGLSSSEKSNQDLLIESEKLYQKLPWTEIEAKVGTRYWRQCKQKWITILTNKMTKGQKLYRGTKGLEAKINLIKRLYEMNVEDANEVNWEELSKVIGDVPRAYVQARFYKLKVSYVPFWQKKTFSEIIDYLFEEKLPELEEKLQKSKRKESSDNSQSRQQKKAFRLSDIFDSSEDSE